MAAADGAPAPVAGVFIVRISGDPFAYSAQRTI